MLHKVGPKNLSASAGSGSGTPQACKAKCCNSRNLSSSYERGNVLQLMSFIIDIVGTPEIYLLTIASLSSNNLPSTSDFCFVKVLSKCLGLHLF